VTQPTAAQLAEVLGRTLDEAAFVFTDPQEAPPPFTGSLIEARIRYDGPATGVLCLATGPEMAATLAANLLGAEESDVTPALRRDAVGELLNMVVGALVAQVYGEESRCRLGVPQVRELAAAAYAGGQAQRACATHLVEEHGRRIDLSLHAEAAAP